MLHLLLQTTIEDGPDDWNISRFSHLNARPTAVARRHLASLYLFNPKE
ncbi:hypothetical protein [Variovorax sp. JS1663]|nr:hypothetical protein [Variovorax sp. JS1663]